ncbi:MAG: fibronectin type III domain-containing protein, partial [Pseudomonadales bacterium]|nr:fibronectin type III domain-containing protein [Pseudomonadales bacterium]
GSAFSLAADLNCSASVCSTQVLDGGSVTLSALGVEGFELEAWSGLCAGSPSDCTIVVDDDVSLSVSFIPIGNQVGSVLVNWSAPVEREDGSPLLADDILSYTVYYGQKSGEYSDAITVELTGGFVPTSVTLEDLEEGMTYYIAGITVDANGVSSQLSNEIQRTASSILQ